jgi:hypothetical protein
VNVEVVKIPVVKIVVQPPQRRRSRVRSGDLSDGGFRGDVGHVVVSGAGWRR